MPETVQTLDDYLAQLASPEMVSEMSRRAEVPQKRIVEILQTFMAEARYGYQCVMPYLPRGGRILEVGSGLGMLSGFLRRQGYDIIPLEPYAIGFGVFTHIHSFLVEKGYCPPALCIGAEELSPQTHGRFDFIFSVNVLEHIGVLEQAVAAMVSVLSEDGFMWHSCANYTVPYEPHFAIPLVPFFPSATRWLLPRRITGSDLWKSFNFITVGTMRRLAAKNGCSIAFQPSIMAQSFRRLDTDPEFAARHKKGPVPPIYAFLKATGLLKLIEALPPALNTPMSFEMRSAGKS